MNFSHRAVLSVFLLLLVGWPDHATAAPARPVIVAVRDKIVRVHVPKGIRKVTLEARTGRERSGRSRWQRKLVAHLDGSGGNVKFVLSSRIAAENLRVIGAKDDPQPSSLYDDTTFLKLASDPAAALPGAISTTDAAGEKSAQAVGSSTSIQESDIWKISGQKLFFFNQYRGLQIFDLSDPDSPAQIGSLRMTAVGEEMYLLGPDHAALLKHGYSFWANGSSGSEVAIVDVSAKPKVVASLPITGYATESRLVGDRLYVVSQDYGWRDGKWENATVVASFDLSSPAHPLALGTLRLPGYANVVSATDGFLFVVSYDQGDWRSSVINVVNLDAAALQLAGTIRPAGVVGDKFKLNAHDGVLTVISQVQRAGGARIFTRLENFSLLPPPFGKKIAELDLAVGESTRGTRFAGDVAYVCTFFQIDPLWVLDLSDPLHPRVSGHLEVPGFSSFMQPLDDGRLVTIGRLNGNTAVALFDVRDPAHPQTLSQLTLGDQWSYSEADYNEKAFNVLADDELILVPFAGYGSDGYAAQVQLIDLKAGSLVKRGTIAHGLNPRRATVFEKRIVAISGTDLLSVDATDRDHPIVKADLAISWPVHRVFLAGDFLIEIANGDGWAKTGASITISPASDPDTSLAEIPLGDRLVVGADLHEGKLYLAQSPVASFTLFQPLIGTFSTDSAKPKTSLTVSVFDLSKLPSVHLLGSTQNEFEVGTLTSLAAVWPGASTLVWVARGFGGYWGGPIYTLNADSSAMRAVSGFRSFPYWSGSPERLLAYDVGDSAKPRLVSNTDLSASVSKAQQWPSATPGNWSDPFVEGTRLFLSHEGRVRFLNPRPLPSKNESDTIIVKEGEETEPIAQDVSGDFLDVIDFADPAHPAVHDPVNIPGALKGIGAGGARLYTASNAPFFSDENTEWAYSVQASEFDGTAARLIAKQRVDQSYSSIATSAGVFLVPSGNYDGENSTYALQAWKLGEDDKFHLLDEVALTAGASSLRLFGDLLAVQTWDGRLNLFNAADAAELEAIGAEQLAASWYADLENSAGGLDRGLWLPLGAYGAQFIELGEGK